jgi:hypothetical protein
MSWSLDHQERIAVVAAVALIVALLSSPVIEAALDWRQERRWRRNGMRNTRAVMTSGGKR